MRWSWNQVGRSEYERKSGHANLNCARGILTLTKWASLDEGGHRTSRVQAPSPRPSRSSWPRGEGERVRLGHSNPQSAIPNPQMNHVRRQVVGLGKNLLVAGSLP